MKINDPIVAAVRAERDKYAARFGYDIKEIFKDIRTRQQSSGREYTSYPPRLVTNDQHSTSQPSTFEPSGPGPI